ncbi:MAG: iron-sulfur cluster assembly scaffold protein [Thermomicrobiales bacterium]
MDRQEYIEYILDHFQEPRNRGRMDDASIQLGGGNPGCGDLITLYLKIDEDERIERASFEGEGCTISQAGGSIISEMIEGMTIDDLKQLGTHTMIAEMGEDVVKSRVRCATLALGTAQAAADAWRRERQHAARGIAPEKTLAGFEN